ncbi:tetratricopeptide repeat protein [Hyphococcus sp.]|jgi:tetratricopeptide (TPR) repeat protein|uniref:tetratricopeptide repeat protein n=1 Tax=Hyphococcus sp. TaxID=2038636 RepID=UPI003D0AE5C2
MRSNQKEPSSSQVEAVVTLYNKGELDAAFAAAVDLIREFPQAAFLYNICGAINAQKNKYEEAVENFRRAVDIDPGFPDAHNNLGATLRKLGRQEEALQHYARAVEIRPDYAEAYFNMANALRDLDRREEAVSNYKAALNIAPKHYGAHNNLGLLLSKLERYEEAIGHFSIVLLANPNYFEAYNNLGLALKKLGREKEALASFAKAIAIKPDYAQAHYNLASYYFDLGRKEEAASSYDDALRIDPEFAEAYRSRSALKQYVRDDPEITLMQRLLERDEASDYDRMQLSYALGKASEDIGDYDNAFAHYARGNALRRQFLKYEPGVERALFRRIKEAFADKQMIERLRADVETQGRQAPVFVVGMPRSGTSLTEQILSCHSKIYGAGELMTLGKAVTAVWREGGVKPEQVQAIREKYLADMRRRNAAEPYVTDKMNLNYRWIGFILLAMPEAKIIHIKRRSIASCWSIFKYYFTDFGNGYAYDLDDIADYYSGYMDLMRFWNELFPGAIYNFSYESLTENQEEETRRLLDYLGLDLEQACIDFHESHRAVATISSMQVRKKLYAGSSDEWRKYKKFLGPVLDRLGED